MSFGWVLLGFIGIVILFALMHVVTRMAIEREALARRKRARTSSLSADTITYAGHG